MRQAVEMDSETMTVTLSPHGMELLRAVRNAHPERSVAEILEEALAERLGHEVTPLRRSAEEVRAWLDELASLSDKIAPRPGETFSREMIYQDHA
jgi:hypothetical protein